MKRKLLLAGVGVVVALALFAAVGYLAAPPLLKHQLEKYARESLQRELAIGEIKLNPFNLRLEIRDLALKDQDGSDLASVGRLVVDYEIFPALFRRAFGFREISFVRPVANVVIDKEGSLNFARLIADATQDQPPKASAEKQPLPRIIIDKLEVDDAAADFTDRFRTKPFKTRVDPIDVLLVDFNTLPDEEGKQTIVASTPDGEHLKWVGEFKLSPIQSHGTIELTGLAGRKIWRFGEEMLNFEIPSGRADVSMTYEIDLNEPQMRLHLRQMKAHLKEWALESRIKGDRALLLQDLQVGPGDFDYGRRELVLEKFVLQGGGLWAQRGSDNLINWVELLKLRGAAAAREAAAATTGPPGEEGGSWKIGIKEFRVADFGITFSDDAAQTPYDAAVKSTAVTCEAEIDYSPKGSQVKLDGVVVGLSDIGLKPRTETAPIFTLASIELGKGTADYKDKSVRFDALRISKPRGVVWIDPDGNLNWAGLAPKPSESRSQPTKTAEDAGQAPTAREQPWRVTLNTLEAVEGAVAFTDRGMTPPVTVNVEPIRVRLDALSTDLTQAVRYDLDIGIKPGGQLTSKGAAIPASPSAEGTVTLKDLALKPGQQYVNKFAFLLLNSGTVSATGKYAFALRDGKPTAQFNGGIQVTKLDLVEEGTKERFLGWDLMDVRGIDFKLEPSRLDIVEIRLDKPGGKFIIYEDRTLNVQRILRAAEVKGGAASAPRPAFEQRTEATTGNLESGRQVSRESATSAAPAQKPTKRPAAATTAASAPFPVNIQRVRVNRGELFFADLTLTPQFGTKIHKLNGTVNSLSTRKGSKAQMKLEGAVDEYGLARFSGDLFPFAPTDYLNVTAAFRNVELTSMTPYSAKFAGYRIASGKLDADLQYFIQQRQLKGENQIIIDQLTLGERVESPDAVQLPLELAIALLKDSDGKIDLGLPVSGSLEDPQFSIGGLIWKAVVNVLTKVVTAPFRALGALLGIESEKLEGVSFDFGSDVLLPPEKEKLTQVVAALEKRPQLKLGIRPVYAPQDADAIRSVRIRRELAGRAGFKLQEGEDPGPLDASDPKNQKLIQALFVERFGKDELRKVSEALEQAQTADGKVPPKEAKEQLRTQLAEALLAKLNESEKVSDEELQALAQRRAETLKQAFEAEGKLPMDRVAIEPVEKVEASDMKMVESKFALASK